MTLVELLLAITLAGLLVTGAIRLAVAGSDQQRAVLQSTSLQAELRRAAGVVQQVVAERPFLLPLRGNTAGFEFLQSISDSRFRVLGVSSTGLTVRFLSQGFDPRALRRAVVVDTGGNGYVYTLSRITVLDAATGVYLLEGTACAVPSGQGLRGVGATLVRLGSGAALNSFMGEGSLDANQLYFQEEDRTPEVLMQAGAPLLRYAYRAGDGQMLYQETASLFQQARGQRYDLAGLSLGFQVISGTGSREARRDLKSDLLFQADAGLGLRRLDCSPLAGPPALGAGDWRVEILGLDPGVSALVSVAGPAGFSRTLTASTTLTGLQQGSYALSAQSVVNPGLPFVRYRPAAPAEGSTLGVEVGGANRPVTQVRYTRLPGRLRVQLEGLPAGLSTSLGAAGTFATYNFELANGEHRMNLEAGRYNLAWPEVNDPAGRGVWRAEPPSQTVDVPSEGEGDAGTIRYTLIPSSYRLELNVRVQGGTAPVLPRVCIQPKAEIGVVSPDALISECPFNP